MDSALLWALGCFLVLLACFGWGQPRVPLHIEHWGKPIPGLDETSDRFYARLYQRFKARLTDAGLPDSKIGFGPGNLFGNRTVFGARPQYLVVRYSHLTIYVYCYPLPGGLYVSYWAFSKYTGWEDHPVLKWVLAWRMYQMSIYQFDVMDMCMGLINNTIHEVIDEYCAEQGLKPLEEYERRPVLQSFYARYKQGNPQSPHSQPQPALFPIAAASPAVSGGPTMPAAVASKP